MSDSAYEGIDLANGLDNLGRCFLCDDGQRLTVEIEEPGTLIMRTAIDCPFGTTEGFEKLLHGDWPTEQPIDGFKSRKTELWLKDHVEHYRIVQRWRGRTEQEREQHPDEAFFNRGGHIQPTLRMSIVPECLWYIANRFNKELPVEKRKQNLVDARRGDGPWVEAHPRIFLYSMVERLFRADSAVVDLDTLFMTARYKAQADNRRELYRLFRENRRWMGKQVRDIQPAAIPDDLEENHHRFDAFLCALTAWAHQHSECLGWPAAEIEQEIVDIEGHILVLRQTERG